MPISLNTNEILLESGKYFGRVMELIYEDKKLNEMPQCEKLNILVLVQDQLYSLEINKKSEISKGAIISFNVNSNSLVENIKTVQIPHNFDAEGDVLRWRRPTKNPTRMELLRTRHRIMRGVREWFDRNKFIETETPILVSAPSPESQFSPVRTNSGFLITSPEFQMKRMLVGGFEKIYQISRCFRNDEIGPIHNPEFTILEWYRTGEPLETLINDIEQLVINLIENAEESKISINIPQPPWPRVKVSDLFDQHLGIILDGSETAGQLREKAKCSGLDELLVGIPHSPKLTDSLEYEQIFFQLWQKIEGEFPMGSPIFVFEWPLTLASLARPCEKKNGFVDRVELYVNGMELANGFGELTDVVEQRLRFEKDLKNRTSAGYESVPLDEKFLKSMGQGLPKSSGMSLGVDRLIMWLCSVKHIQDVLCFSNREV